MFPRQMDAARAEVMRLIDEQVDKVLLPLKNVPDLLKREGLGERQRNLSSEAIKQWEEILQSERYKVDRLEASFVVIGTMKSGKSTTINTIVGTEVLPNRNQPMTTLPTVIRHYPGKWEPELFFPDPGPMNQLMDQLCKILRKADEDGSLKRLAFCATESGKELVRKIIDGSLGEVYGHYKGQQEIFDFLKNMNDIWRLCISKGVGIDIDRFLGQYDDIQKFPAIEVEFTHLDEQACDAGNGKFTLIDTPGPNEAGQVFLKKIMREQLEKASAVIAVLDYTQLNAEADADIRRSLDEVANVTSDRLFVFVNKFDQKDRHSMDAETLRTYVAKQLFEGRLDETHVYPISSRYGYLATRAERELERFHRLPDPRVHPWVEDFAFLALGTFWEEKDFDSNELKNRAAKLWQHSCFDSLLTNVVQAGYANSASMSLRAALDKMLEYNKRIVESLQLRKNALNTDFATIEDNVRALTEKIILIHDSNDEARRLIDESTKILEKKVFRLFDEIDRIVNDEIRLVFERENSVLQRLAPFVNNMSRKKPVEINPQMRSDFSSPAEANHFIDKLVAAGVETIEPRLQEIQKLIETAVNELITEVWTGVNGRLGKALEAAERSMNETFAIAMEFPKPSVQAIQIDFNALYQSSIKEDEITRVNTKFERKWYTLWSRKHKVVYQQQEHIYCVYIQDVITQLQTKLKNDLDNLWKKLERYMDREFNPAINNYFVETADYLQRFGGDLADAMHDKKLQGEQLESLLLAIQDILTTSYEQQERLQEMKITLFQPVEEQPVI